MWPKQVLNSFWLRGNRVIPVEVGPERMSVCKTPNETTTICLVQSIFYLSDCIKNRLVFVGTAGSATTGSLELPALGADIGPRREIKQHLNMKLLHDHVHFGSSKNELSNA